LPYRHTLNRLGAWRHLAPSPVNGIGDA